MRWLYHLLLTKDAQIFPYAPASLALEGFIHASYRPLVAESARLYFAANALLSVYCIDPRVIGAALIVASTPRGPMPHIHRALSASDVLETLTLAELEAAPDLLDEAR